MVSKARSFGSSPALPGDSTIPTGSVVSETEHDSIILAPRYGSEISLVSGEDFFTTPLETGRSYALNFSIKNIGQLSWDPNDVNNPVHLLAGFVDGGGNDLELKTNYGQLKNVVSYGESGEIAFLLRIPEKENF